MCVRIKKVTVRNMKETVPDKDWTKNLRAAYKNSRKNNLDDVICEPKRKCWNFPKIKSDPFDKCRKEITITLEDVNTGNLIFPPRVFVEGDPLTTSNRSIHFTLP